MPSECFIFSSDSKNGAFNKSVDGSRFSIQMNEPFFLPPNAYNARLSVIQASIWNNSPNISSALNNNKFVLYDSNGTHTVYVQDGLYDIDSLYSQLAFQFDNLQFNRPFFPFREYFSFSGNESTNRLYITYLNSGQTGAPEIKWADSTITATLGFLPSSPTKPSNPYTPSHEFSLESPNTPRFNAYNSFVLHSDLVNAGIRINDSFDQIIAQIPITSNVGELTMFKATAPQVACLCNNLIGPQSARWNFEFWLTSETGVPLDTRGENYDFIVEIDWLESD